MGSVWGVESVVYGVLDLLHLLDLSDLPLYLSLLLYPALPYIPYHRRLASPTITD